MEVHLGAFGAVGKMTAETVDYLLHVLEDVRMLLLTLMDVPVLSGRLSTLTLLRCDCAFHRENKSCSCVVVTVHFVWGGVLTSIQALWTRHKRCEDEVVYRDMKPVVANGCVYSQVRASLASEAARARLNCSTDDDDNEDDDGHVAGLVRSHSYEALVQLEGILEARHHRIMNDGLLGSLPDDIS